MRYRQLLLILLLPFSACSYLPEEGELDRHLRQEEGDYALYYSGYQLPGKAFLMVPGGLVDPHVYSCWISRLVDEDPTIAVVLVKYPSNLAIMNAGKVLRVKDQLQDFSQWVIGGHSLGGTVAAMVLSDHPNDFEGLVLMGSWSREATDLSYWQGAVLSMYASEDQLASEEEILGNEAYLPEGNRVDTPDSFSVVAGKTIYYRIVGGNHAGFGCYGPQNGDGEATVTAEMQHDYMIAAMKTFFAEVW